MLCAYFLGHSNNIILCNYCDNVGLLNIFYREQWISDTISSTYECDIHITLVCVNLVLVFEK